MKQFAFYKVTEEFWTYIKKNKLEKELLWPTPNSSVDENKSYRPCLFAISDSKNKEIFWMVPSTSTKNRWKKYLDPKYNPKYKYQYHPVKHILHKNSLLSFTKSFPCMEYFLEAFSLNNTQPCVHSKNEQLDILKKFNRTKKQVIAYNQYCQKHKKLLTNPDFNSLYKFMEKEVIKYQETIKRIQSKYSK